jgi:hypothetical protein
MASCNYVKSSCSSDKRLGATVLPNNGTPECNLMVCMLLLLLLPGNPSTLSQASVCC